MNQNNLPGAGMESPESSRSPVPLSEYMREFLAVEVEPFVQESTYRTYLDSLRASFYPESFSSLSVSMLSEETIQTYYAQLLSRKSRRSVEIIVTLTKRLFEYLYKKKLTDENYSEYAFMPRRPRQEYDRLLVNQERLRKKYFSEEDIHKLYYAYKTRDLEVSERVKEYLPLIILQIETFLRGSETISIFKESVDLEKDLLWIRNSVGKRYRDNKEGGRLEKYLKAPKNGEERVVPLSPLAKDAVIQMLRATSVFVKDNPLGLLYPNLNNGKMRSIDAYERSFKKICAALDIDLDPSKTDCLGRSYGLSTHALRHTGITLANTAVGANILNTALMAGHSIHKVGGNYIGAESAYTHTLISALRTVKTPSMLLGLGTDPATSADTPDSSIMPLLERIVTDQEELSYLRALLDEILKDKKG